MKVAMRVASALLALLVCRAVAAAAGEATTLVLLGTTDIHGHLEATREEVTLDGGAHAIASRGGLALFAGYVDSARRSHPGRVVLLDAGDMLQGTVLSNLGEGAATVRAMNELAYDASAIGNHEFDYGPVGPHATPQAPGEDPRGALAARAREARQPWLTCNIIDEKTGLPPGAPAVRRFTLIERAGIKIGIIGATTEETPRTTIKLNLGGLRIEPLVPAVIRTAAEVRKAGAQVVILVAHAGGECARFDRPDDLSSCLPDSELFTIARRLPEGTVDAIFGGHTHQGVSAIVHGIPVAQAFSYGVAFSRIDLEVDRATGRPIPGRAKVYPPTEICGEVTDGVPTCDPKRARGHRLVAATYEGRPVVAEARVAASFADDIAKAASRRAERLGVRLETPVPRAFKVESPLGNLVADALRRSVAGADIGLTNGGGLRADLPAGELTFGSLYEALPFDNRVTRVRMPGAQLRRLIVANLAGAKGILSLSGLRAEASCRGGALEVALTLDDGRPLDDARLYTVATSDFLALGGDDFGPLAGKVEVAIDEAGAPMRDVVIEQLRARGRPLRADDPAIFDPARPRVRLPGPRPIRCGARY